jgi:hypothetical protein
MAAIASFAWPVIAAVMRSARLIVAGSDWRPL